MDSLKIKAYKIIKQRILDCQYAPNTFINDLALMEELDVSRTPIREALSMLETEGFIKVLPKKGVVVSGITLKTVSHIFEARLLLEPFIIQNYMDFIDHGALLQIKQKSRELAESPASGNQPLFAELDDHFHRLIAQCCQNIFFIESLTYIFDQNQRIRKLTEADLVKRHTIASYEHIAIIEDILAKNYPDAAQKMIIHLNNSREVALKNLGYRDVQFL